MEFGEAKRLLDPDPLPLSPEEQQKEMTMQMGLDLMKRSYQEWSHLMRFLPAVAIAERRNAKPAPVAW